MFVSCSFRYLALLFVFNLGVSGFAVYAQDGGLDTTFDGDGILMGGPFSGSQPMPRPQSDGHWIIASQVEPTAFTFGIEVVRVDPTGAPDATFGSSGARTIEFPDYIDPVFGGGGYLWDVDVLPDDSIVITASGDLFVCDGDCEHTSDVVIVKLDADGDLDGGFGTGGYSVAPFAGLVDGSGNDRFLAPWELKAAADGSLFVVGTVLSDRDLVMVKLTPSGVLDPSFGTGGELFVDSADQATYVDIVFLDDGRIVVVGGEAPTGGDRVPMAKVLLADGTPDSVTALSDEQPGFVTRMLPDASGGFFVAGYSGLLMAPRGDDLRRVFVRRLHGDLTVDDCFGIVEYPAETAGWRSSVQGAGVMPGNPNPVLVVMEGEPDPDAPPGSSNRLQSHVKLIRLNQGGGLDSTFGVDGVVDLSQDPDFEIQTPLSDPVWHGQTFATSLGLWDPDEVEDAISGVMRFTDGTGIMGSGFETGDTMAWGAGCRAGSK